MAIEFLEYVVGSLVDQPEEVTIDEIAANDETILELRVDDDDVGRIIGRNGSVARSLRTIVSAIGSRDDKQYTLEIID